MPIYELFSRDGRFRCTIQQELYRPEYWCEIMPRKATKAEAIKSLKALWNCDRIVSFGDAINDIPMFELSDECYAVENAVPELKKAATGIIDSNDQDGVAKWLERNAVLSWTRHVEQSAGAYSEEACRCEERSEVCNGRKGAGL